MDSDGCKPEQHAGLRGSPKIAQRRSAPSWTHRTPAGLPSGMPGIALEMDGAMQQAPQFSRHAWAEFGSWAVSIDSGQFGHMRHRMQHIRQPGIVPPSACGDITQESVERVR
jgi:oxygen-independent coproporphyrinogen-3 oxidase